MLTSERIVQIAGGFAAAEVLMAALELGLFTELGKGPRSYRQLQRVLGLDERAAPDFLDALVALRLIDRDGSTREAIYVNTRESDLFLDSNSPAYIGGQLRAANARFASLWTARARSLKAAEDAPPN